VNSATQITATVPSGVSSGQWSVTTPGGTATSAGTFTVTTPPAPTLSGFSPTSGLVGASVTLTGTNFTGATSVLLGSAAANYVVNSATQITATVPAGAASGQWKVTTAGGTATSAASFSVTTAPAPPGGGGGGGGGGLGPDLQVAVSASSEVLPANGSDFIFTVTVSMKNSGNSSDTRLLVTLPAGFTVTRVYTDRGGCAYAAPTLLCDVAWINPTNPTHVTIFGTISEQVNLSLVATVTSLLEPEFDPTNNTTTMQVFLPDVAGAGTKTPAGVTAFKVVKAPTVTGSTKPGATLRAKPGSWTKTPQKVSYQWQVCSKSRCTAIRGAKKLTLKLGARLRGRVIRFTVTATSDTTTLTSSSKRLSVPRK
jgi:hypothetical protein